MRHRVGDMIVRLAEHNTGYTTEEVAADVAEILADVRLVAMGMDQSISKDRRR